MYKHPQTYLHIWESTTPAPTAGIVGAQFIAPESATTNVRGVHYEN